jgi:hypothetical protein
LVTLSEARAMHRDVQPPAHLHMGQTPPSPAPLRRCSASVVPKVVGGSHRSSPDSIPPVAHFSATPDVSESDIENDTVRLFVIFTL